MTDISVKHEPDSGAAVIEIRGAKVNEARFRLRDPATDKYLTKRGWTKTASFLPVDAVEKDGVWTIALDADLARKITPHALLSLEQPSSSFQEAFNWREPVADPVANDEEEAANDAVVAKPEPASTDIAALFGGSTLEPSIMHEHLHDDPKPEDRKQVPFADMEEERASWAPAVIAAALFFVLGLGIAYFLFGGSDEAAVRQAQQTAKMQMEKERWEFQRQLAEAKEQAETTSLDKSNANNAQIADLNGKTTKAVADLELARKELSGKAAEIQKLQEELADANAQVEATRASAGDKAKAQLGVLDQKIASLNGELDKAKDAIADRDRQVQDAQSKLNDANDQIAAVKDAAQKESEALNADLTDRTDKLNVELDAIKKQVAAKDTELQKARAALQSAKDGAQAETDAQSASLTQRVDALTIQAKDQEKQIADRDKALRDAQAKLSVANIQIDALKVVAGKSTESDLEQKALNDKVTRLAADLDKASQQLADKDKALADTKAKLADAEQKAATETTDTAEEDTAAADEKLTQLQQERDIYSNELKTMTQNFTALQQEKAELQKSVAALEKQGNDPDVSASATPSKAIWGATAIDEAGAIYALQNQTDEKAAKENVNAICRGKSKYKCELLTTYSNACFSLARIEGEGPAVDNFAYFVHKNWKKSTDTAIERCRSMGANCTLRISACSPDALSKPVSD